MTIRSLTAAILVAVSGTAVAGRITVLDMGLEAGKATSNGCPTAAASFVRALGGTHAVTIADAADCERGGVFDRRKTDLVIVPSGTLFPYALQEEAMAYLEKGGLMLSCGGYVFDAPSVRKDGRWVPAEPPANPPLPLATTPVALPPPDAWRHNTSPGQTTLVSAVTGPACAGVRISTPLMRTWNMRYCEVGPFPAETGAISFWIRADEHTREAKIELNEKDRTRWQTLVPVTTEWRRVTLVWNDFTFHPDSPTVQKGRGHAKDRIAFADVRQLSVGMTRAPGNGNPGDPATRRRARHVDICGVTAGPDPDAAKRFRVKPIRRITSRKWKSVPEDYVTAFYPSYRYEDVARLTTAPEVAGIFPTVAMKGPLSGWDAYGRVANRPSGHADQIVEVRPLLACFDADGTPHGLGGSILHHFGGRFKGGTWAIFGVDSCDLFADARNDAFLQSVVGALLRRVWLAVPHAVLPCYRVGETAEFETMVCNGSSKPLAGEALFALRNEEGALVASGRVPFRVKAGANAKVPWTWPVPAEARDYYDLTVELVLEGQVVDRAADGVAVWRPEVAERGITVSRGNGTVLFDGKCRFLVGAQPQVARNQTYVGASARRCREEYRRLSRAGLKFARSFFGFDFRWKEDDPEAQKLVRLFDASVMFAQKYGVAHYFTMRCGNDLGEGGRDASLENETRWFRFFAERYRRVPGLLWDVRNEARLNLMPGESLQAGSEWMRRWAENAAGAVWSRKPDALVGVGWGQGWAQTFAPWGSRIMDPLLAAEGHNLTDTHYYGTGEDFDAEVRKIDRRVFGIPVCVGEFGCAFNPLGIPHRVEYVDNPGAERRYCQQVLKAFGLGCSFISHYGFEFQSDGFGTFGLVQRDYHPLPCFATYRRLASVLGAFERMPDPPDTVLVFSKGRYLAKTQREMRRALAGGMETAAALAWHGANFSTIAEHEVGMLPPGVKCIIRSEDYEVQIAAYDTDGVRARVGAALAAAGAFHTRRQEDPARIETYRVRGTEGRFAWVLWNDEIARSHDITRFGTRITVPAQHGVFLVTDRSGRLLVRENF